jgi:nucleoside phosphorylase
MNTKEVRLIFMDTKERFEEVKSQISFKSFKKIHQFDSFKKLKDFLNNSDYENENIFVFIHIVAKTLEGYNSGLKDDIISEFQHLNFYWITRATSSIKPNEIDSVVYTYNQLKEKIQKGIIKPQLVNDIIHKKEEKMEETVNKSSSYKAEYAIITALEENEMEKILLYIKKEGKIDNEKILIEFGHLISNPNKKIAYASQQSTGIVDASILATEMILRFQPKFLIMAGVIGGKPGEVNIGDIIVSTKAFTIDKGKITDEEILTEIESSNTDSSYVTSFKRNKNNILKFIESADPTRNNRLNIHFGPIACVRQVIDKKEYFENKILVSDRKTIGLEMESFGVARACELINDGKTIPLIIKSAMDNTHSKVDEAKSYASWTSATFVQYILENNLI